jgi:hypothetical protein
MKRYAILLILVLGLNAVAQTQHGLQFSWTEPVGSSPPVASFNLYCGTATGGEPATPTVSGITANPYLWTGGIPNTTYYCNLTAVDTLGLESGHSNEVFQTFPAPPQAPTGLSATQK